MCLPIASSPGQIASSERLVDDGDERRVQIVAIGEVASARERNAHAS